MASLESSGRAVGNIVCQIWNVAQKLHAAVRSSSRPRVFRRRPRGASEAARVAGAAQQAPVPRRSRRRTEQQQQLAVDQAVGVSSLSASDQIEKLAAADLIESSETVFAGRKRWCRASNQGGGSG